MARRDLSPGDVERLALCQAEKIVLTLELLVPRFLPGIVGSTAECDHCGALVGDKSKHTEWHRNILFTIDQSRSAL
jgi:hypothetical protein